MGIHPCAARRGPALQTPREIASTMCCRPSASGPVPRFGHLPIVMVTATSGSPSATGLGAAGLRRGRLPARGGPNYLAPLGAGHRPADRDVFTMTEMAQAFDIRLVTRPGPLRPQEARRDQRRPHAAARPRGHDPAGDALPAARRGGCSDPATPDEAALLTQAMPLVHERMEQARRGRGHARFLFVDEAAFVRDPADAEKLLDDDGGTVVRMPLRRSPCSSSGRSRRHRGGAAGGPRRRARPQAAQRLRAGARRYDRTLGLAAVVRVHGAARCDRSLARLRSVQED